MQHVLKVAAFAVLALAATSAQAQQISCQGSCRIICFSFDPLDGNISSAPITSLGEQGNDRNEVIKRVVSVGLNSFIVYWDDNVASYYGFPPSVSCRVHSNSKAHVNRR